MVIGKYLRLSIADGDLGKDNKDESNSIDNQRLLIDKYIEAAPDLVGETVEYVDDGYSGTNFNRPGFIQMIEDAKKGKIQVIVTKDLSRLGRDYIGVGDYLEQIFPVIGIRFIAVNSYYDSNQYIGTTMGLDMTISNLVNHLYSRDLSIKEKSALRARWNKGVETSTRAPYGYFRRKGGDGRWEIDKESSKVVRLIFELANDGWSTRMIMEHLNAGGYPTPLQYRELSENPAGLKRKTPKDEVRWTTAMVSVILKRYEYTGAAVHGKRERLSLSNTATRRLPRSQWYITEGVHPAIVTKNEFFGAQEVFQGKCKKKYLIPSSYALRGKVRCGNCQLAMQYKEIQGRRYLFDYHKMIAGETSSCFEGYYSLDDLETAVAAVLQTELTQFETLKEQFVIKKKKLSKERKRSGTYVWGQIERIKADRIHIYEAYVDGNITKECYIKKRDALMAEMEAMERELSLILQKEELENRIAKDADAYERVGEDCRNAGSLTQYMVDTYIERVYVFNPHSIEIVFSFEDVLKKLTDYCNAMNS